MSVLETILSPADVKNLDPSLLGELAAETRERIISTVAANGGHLAPSLGTVEMTIALLRVFDFPGDSVLWDVGHQSYAWKILTGRNEAFSSIRRNGGISGFPNPDESPFDAFVAGHAGAALSAAEGIASARDRLGGTESVVAVVGDAAMANGVSLEALNNLAQSTERLIVVLNDNEMSISKNVGSFARMLGRMISSLRYNRVKMAAERAGHKLRLTFLRKAYYAVEHFLKSIWLKSSIFEYFGLRYIGPVDGHDIEALQSAFAAAKEYKRPILVHAVTVKGKGFPPAERNPTLWHGVGPFNVEKSLQNARIREQHAKDVNLNLVEPWSDIFGGALCRLAKRDSRIAALTAAMRDGTGLADFFKLYPARSFDAGICEEHMVTFAAGLAKRGMRPVVAVYSTFLQRAVDNVMHDVCLLRLPVIFAIDRAGVVGADGRTHHGVFDIPMLRCLPGMSIMQPRDGESLEIMLKLALEHGGPAAIRYPRGSTPLTGRWTARRRQTQWGKAEVLKEPAEDGKRIWIWALGDQVEKAFAAAGILEKKGFVCGIVDARFVKPLDAELIRSQIADGAKYFATLENGAVEGGFGSAFCETVSASGVKVLRFGWPDSFQGHGTVAEIEAEAGFTAEAAAEKIAEAFING